MKFISYNFGTMKNLKTKFQDIKENINNWLYDHNGVKIFFDYFLAILLSTVSAFLFAASFNAFMDLGQLALGGGSAFQKILSGGISGLTQIIVLICELLGWESIDEATAYAILYFALNVPLIILAWFGIGKRFTILTLVNVVETSIFIRVFTAGNIELLAKIAIFCSENGGMLARAIFGGVCTGLSSALAYKGDFSAGGIDVVAYYIALRKRTMVGKYSALMNAVTLTIFVILSITRFNGWTDSSIAASYVAGAFYTAIYLFVTKLVIDAINVRNKKLKVEVVTDNKDLGSLLIKAIPHAATMVNAKGVYSGKDKYVFTMVVSSYELPNLMKVIKREDPNGFAQVIPLNQVTGRFFMKPIK